MTKKKNVVILLIPLRPCGLRYVVHEVKQKVAPHILSYRI